VSIRMPTDACLAMLSDLSIPAKARLAPEEAVLASVRSFSTMLAPGLRSGIARISSICLLASPCSKYPLAVYRMKPFSVSHQAVR
jgi:hypothetical protein